MRNTDCKLFADWTLFALFPSIPFLLFFPPFPLPPPDPHNLWPCSWSGLILTLFLPLLQESLFRHIVIGPHGGHRGGRRSCLLQ